MRKRLLLFLGLLLLVLPARTAVPMPAGERGRPVEAARGMVVTSHPEASRVGLEVLKAGGNAVDAAVAVGFALAVVQPRSGNLGGGGFMLFSSGAGDEVAAIDYRETAPAAATRDMFLDAQGEVDPQRVRFSHAAAGVPGTVAGLLMALERYGSWPRERVLAPAIELAERGFALPPRFTRGIAENRDRLLASPAGRRKFLKADGSAFGPGDIFRQPDLARTLRRIAAEGPRGFYGGKTAALLVAEMERGGGLITLADLQNYRPKLRTPVRGTYRGYDVYSMPPPSSGGVHLIEILNILEGYPAGFAGLNSAPTIQLLAEAMKRAYADRSRFLGDPDFVSVPVAGLTSKSYAASLREGIDPLHATPSVQIRPGTPGAHESGETTHYSIVDRYGNAVANTTTLNFSYGSGIVVAGAGFLLNDEMDDFSAKPGVPNAYGLIGGAANGIAPGKRMLSSMAPTIVKKDGRNFLVTGSPGGSTIITVVLQVLLNVIDHRLDIQAAVNAPRVHHQWLPDQLRLEPGIGPDTVRLLQGRGYQVVEGGTMGASQSILIEADGTRWGAADPRRSTSSALGY